MSRHNYQRGFTLVELIVALSIISILGVLILTFLTENGVNAIRKIGRSDQLREAQTALDQVNADIQYSSAAENSNVWPDTYAPGAPSSLLSWQSTASTVVLSAPTTDSSGAFIYADPATFLPYKNNYVYFVQDQKLYRRTLAAAVAGNSAVTSCPSASATPSCPPDLLVASNVSSFTISYLDKSNSPTVPTNAHSLQIGLDLSTGIGVHVIQTSYTIQVVFRNV